MSVICLSIADVSGSRHMLIKLAKSCFIATGNQSLLLMHLRLTIQELQHPVSSGGLLPGHARSLCQAMSAPLILLL